MRGVQSVRDAASSLSMMSDTAASKSPWTGQTVFFEWSSYRRKFLSLTSDNTDSWKAEWQSSQVSRKKLNTQVVKSVERRSTREKSHKKEDTHAPNVRNVANRCVFSMIRGSWCSKSRLAKAAGAEVAVEQRNEKWHEAVARSAFVSQNAKKLTGSGNFWTFRCQSVS